MRFVTISTVRDDGAAQVAKEALEDAGIQVRLKKQGINPYLASVTADVYEVMVPEERVADGESILSRLAGELEQALIAQAGAAAEVEEQDDAKPTPRRRFGMAQAGYSFLGLVFFGVIFAVLYSLLERR
jgi:hypothetical protein